MKRRRIPFVPAVRTVLTDEEAQALQPVNKRAAKAAEDHHQQVVLPAFRIGKRAAVAAALEKARAKP